MVSIVWCGLILLQRPGSDDAQPLPELQQFLKEVQRNLRSDRMLQSQYTYVQTETERHLDKHGAVRKTEVTVSEVYPSLDEELTYRRVVSRNGRPLPPEEVAEQDRDHDRKMEKHRRRLEQEGQDERSRRLAREAREQKEEEEIIAEAFRLYNIVMIGRELRGSTGMILLTFRPKPEYKPRTREAKLLKKIAGRAWFTEDTHQLVRIETDLIDDFSMGLGILARLQKGARGVFERRLVNGEVWLPASASFSGKGRLLLLKSLQIDTVLEFSDYRKYTVDTKVTFH